jgi:hypothetical protein
MRLTIRPPKKPGESAEVTLNPPVDASFTTPSASPPAPSARSQSIAFPALASS